MSASRALPRLRESALPLVAAGAALFSIAVGFAVGLPDPGLLALVSGLLGLGAVAAVLAWPFVGFLTMAFSVFFLLVVNVPGTQRSLNPLDLVLLPMVTGWLLGRGWPAAMGGRAPADPAPLLRAEGRLSRTVLLYFGWAAVSLVPMALRMGSGPTSAAGLSLLRVLQGALIFPLGWAWLRGAGRIRATLVTVTAAMTLFAVVNCVWVFASHGPRAGMVWWVAETREPIGSPNEAGEALVTLWALAQAQWAVRRERWLLVPMLLVIVMLPLTQSRSGMLAFLAYLLLTVRGVRLRWVLAGLIACAVVLPLLPAQLWTRLGNTLLLKQGSTELFTFLVRVYGYRVGFQIFRDHALFGAGYQSLFFLSPAYNPYHLRLVVENFFLSTLCGLGLVGFAIVVTAFVRLFALGPAVLAVARPGTLGHELARRHFPYMVALLVVNATGSSLLGLVGIGHVALWCALLLAAGRLEPADGPSVARGRPALSPAPAAS